MNYVEERMELTMDREEFLKAMEFCRTHSSCAKHCPLRNQCKGAYDMLYMTFAYIDELHKEIENGSEKKEN